MPYGILRAIQSSEEKSGKDPKTAERIAYATANVRGYMHGSKETASGSKAEAKYEHDHPNASAKPFRKKRSGMKGKDAADALAHGG